MALFVQTVLNGQIGLGSSRQQLAASGKVYVVTNPTPGTAIAFANNTAFSATANGLWCISNQNPTGGATIYLDRVKLIQTATAPANGLVVRAECYTASGVVALSGAFLARTPVNVNPGYPSNSGGTVTTFAAGAGTVSAKSNTRLGGVMFAAEGAIVRYDALTFEFGADGLSKGKVGVTAAHAVDPTDIVVVAPPMSIAPGYSGWMNLWGVAPDTNVPSYEFQIQYAEV